MKFIKKTLLPIIIICIFIYSISLRLPYMDKPLGGNHQWLSSTVLRTINIWNEQGIVKSKFNPIMTYSNEADKFINNNASMHSDNSGNYYYTSYPPFSYYAPFITFKILNLEASVLNLQLFNIFSGFIACIFLYFFLKDITKNKISAFVGMCCYLLASANLWYNSNVYMADMFVQWLFIGSVFTLQRYNHSKKRIDLFIFSILLFLSIYTEWLGLFLGITVLIYALMQYKTQKKLFYTTLATILLALGLIVFQFSLINGIESFLNASLLKYSSRSGLDTLTADKSYSYLNPTSYVRILEFYKNKYLWIIMLSVVLLLVRVFQKIYYKSYIGIKTYTSFVGSYFIFLIVPILIHHIVFFNFTAVHEFSTLKASFIICTIIAILFNNIVKEYKYNKKIIGVLIVLSILFLAGSVNSYRKTYENSSDNNNYLKGNTIYKYAKDDELLFLNEGYIGPQIIYYAKRNIVEYKSDLEVQNLLSLRNLKKAHVFIMNTENSELVKDYILLNPE